MHPGHCSAAAVQNALRARGHRVGQRRLARLISVSDEDGADETQIIHALHELGYGVDECATSDKQHARMWLANRIIVGLPVIVCVDNWGHWIAAIGISGSRVIIADSSNEALNKSENGVTAVHLDRFLRRWKAARKMAEKDPPFYAIAVVPQD